MISITSPEGSRNLSKEDLLLLQKACHRAHLEAKDKILDLRVYYKCEDGLLKQLREEALKYESLRILFEDLETYHG